MESKPKLTKSKTRLGKFTQDQHQTTNTANAAACRSIRDVSAPITGEIEGEEAMRKLKEENDYLDEITEINTQKNSNESNQGDL